jgi:hypothetical protein
MSSVGDVKPYIWASNVATSMWSRINTGVIVLLAAATAAAAVEDLFLERNENSKKRDKFNWLHGYF